MGNPSLPITSEHTYLLATHEDYFRIAHIPSPILSRSETAS